MSVCAPAGACVLAPKLPDGPHVWNSSENIATLVTSMTVSESCSSTCGGSYYIISKSSRARDIAKLPVAVPHHIEPVYSVGTFGEDVLLYLIEGLPVTADK